MTSTTRPRVDNRISFLHKTAHKFVGKAALPLIHIVLNCPYEMTTICRHLESSSTTHRACPTPSTFRSPSLCSPSTPGLVRCEVLDQSLHCCTIVCLQFCTSPPQLNGRFWFGDTLCGEKFSKELKNVEDPRQFYNEVSSTKSKIKVSVFYVCGPSDGREL